MDQLSEISAQQGANVVSPATSGSGWGAQQGFAPQPQQQGIMNGNADWRANIDPAYQGIASRYSDVNELAKALYHSSSALRQKMDLNNPEQFAQYRQALEGYNNIPSLPDRYDIDTTDLGWLADNGISPEDQAWVLTKEEMSDLKHKAYNNQLTNEQANVEAQIKNAEKLLDMQAGAAQVYNQAYEASQTLQKEWGNAAPQKCKAVEVALAKTLPQMGCDGKQLYIDLCKSGMMYNPSMLKMLASIGEMSMDRPKNGYSNIAPMDANITLEQLKSDPDFMSIVSNVNHPQCREYTERMLSLARAKHA